VERPREVNLAPGTVVAGYRVISALAEGGMGTVYEVEQIATGARRALKALHERFAGNEDLRERFVREARLTAVIPSDHVAQVLDAGHDPQTGTLYMVMELLEGSTLSREIRRRGAFAWSDALEILRQIAHALGAAHARGIVHRDLKPANVFLSRSRHVAIPLTVKVLDFGIAKAIAGSSPALLGPAGHRPTDVRAAVLGTPSWMAPEQTFTGGAIGPQADVWAFGLLAFLLLTGKHYFPSANAKSASTEVLLREVVLDPIVRASQRAGELGCADRLPPDFDEWFARCVARDPTARFEHALTAYEAFAALTPPRPIEPVPATMSSESPGPPTPMTSVVRRETPVTASETPNAVRAARTTGATAPSGTARVLSDSAPDPNRRKPSLAPAAIAIAVVCGLVAMIGVRARHGEQLSAATLAAQRSTGKTIVRLHGSNTMGAELVPALAEAFLRRRTGATTVLRRRIASDELVVEAHGTDGATEEVEVHAHGSATAFDDLGAGRCDIGMASRRVREDEASRLSALGNMASAASEHVIALDGIAVIVNPSNGVTSLTKAQIADIFTGKVANWSELGGRSLPIAIEARDDRSGTYDTFKNLVLGAGSLSPNARRFESSEELSDAVAADERAIGFIGLPYIRSAKAVMVQEAGSAPLLPSPMTVSTEDYPLARRLYLYVPPAAPIAARDFIDFALSEEGQRVVEASGFVDLRPECDTEASRCTACSTEYRDSVRGACRLSVDFRFDRGRTELDTRALRDLQRIVGLMARAANASRSLLLFGFSDATGSRPDNMTLSRQRAGIVASQLRARGLTVAMAHGFGPDMPVADNTTEDGRERNRRVEIWLR
jgi:phosphate transport system substrate-binding protein